MEDELFCSDHELPPPSIDFNSDDYELDETFAFGESFLADAGVSKSAFEYDI
jgi:hypothetical protein